MGTKGITAFFFTEIKTIVATNPKNKKDFGRSSASLGKPNSSVECFLSPRVGHVGDFGVVTS